MSNGGLEIFLKLDGIPGESTVDGHEDETVVLSYEQQIGKDSDASRPSFSFVRFRKPVDKGSVPLLLACASGWHIKDAQFTFRRAATGFVFYKVKLEDVLVRNISQRAGTGAQYPLSFDTMTAGGANEGFLDEAWLGYARIHWEYKLTGPGPGSTFKGGWDIALNRKI
jgi:type VI secretion system secreted protein Hcp